MEIRFLTADDANEWWRLRQESLEGEPEAFSSSLEDHQSLKLEDVRKRLGSEGEEFFVAGAFEGVRLAGMAGFVREKGLKTRHKGRIWGVYVTPGKRGQGIGRKMLQKVLERGAAIDRIDQILISVTSTQTVAACLYRSLGFERFGCEPRALKIGGRYGDEDYMMLVLKRS